MLQIFFKLWSIVTLAQLTFGCVGRRSPSAEVFANKGAGLSIAEVKNKHLRAIENVVQALKASYIEEEHGYVFIGQSTTPFYAYVTSPKSHHVSLPLDRVDDLVYTGRLNCSDTFIFQKLADHFDIYLQPLLKAMMQGQAPAKMVVIDYTTTGINIGRLMQLMHMYLRHYEQNHEDFKKWVASKNKYPEVFFFALTDPGFRGTVEKNIRLLDVPFDPGIKGKVRLKRVKPGSIHGDEKNLVTVDTVELAEKLNSKRPSFDGKILELDRRAKNGGDRSYGDLVDDLFWSRFDQLSPYGAWHPLESALDKAPPRLRVEFKLLQSTLTKR